MKLPIVNYKDRRAAAVMLRRAHAEVQEIGLHPRYRRKSILLRAALRLYALGYNHLARIVENA